MSDAELRNVDRDNLCRGYAKTKSKKIASAINDLGFMNEQDWEALSRGEFYVGMSECVLLIGYKSRQQCQITGTVRNKNGDFIRSWYCYSSFFSKKQLNIELKTVNGSVTLIKEKPLNEQLPELLKLLG